jgi:cyclic beta-1,2-glucan synthetase
VIAADVSGGAGDEGRGGWSWYTGAAAWMWRLGLEAILGIRLADGGIALAPRLPKTWGRAEVQLRRASGGLTIRVEDPDRLGSGEVEVTIGGKPWTEAHIPFPEDGTIAVVTARIVAPAVRERTSAG